MNEILFNQASNLYNSGDYRGALRKYTACLKDTSMPFEVGEMGLIYHRIGNCLVKLKNPAEAIKSYAQASSDQYYNARGALFNSIGMAYASLKDYGNAVANFKKAVDDENYDTPYKAYMGLGNAQLKLGKSAEAGIAFREAALDEENPDPAKALLNLGVCFMALNRPVDAISSYESALQFDMANGTKNRLYASMGQAYAANNQVAEAVKAFQEATADGTYALSDSAAVDYQRCSVALSRSGSGETQMLGNPADTSGIDVPAEGYYFDDDDMSDPFFYDDGYDEGVEEQSPVFAAAYDNVAEDRFFTASDEELEEWSRGLAKKDRKRRNVGLKVLIIVIVILALVMAAGVFAYTQGYGWPTQESVTKELFADPDGAKTRLYSSSLSKESIESLAAPIVQDSDVQIDGVNRSMSDSVVFATAETSKHGQVTYKISMVRDLIGWKISGVELYFPSQNN